MSTGRRTRTLVILGAGSDLTERLLLPGLATLLATDIGSRLLLIGSGRDDRDDALWRERVRAAFATVGAEGSAVDDVSATARWVQADASNDDDLRRLLDTAEGDPILYFALPPAVTVESCRALRRVGLRDGTQLVLEKPFGTDARSAAALNELVTSLVPEDHVHRVDHFLGMATVLNILGLRFANRIIEPVLNAHHVASVQITADESLALEGRAGYYDSAGALVDMLQSHLLEVLALVAMEPPRTLRARDVRDAKAQVLRATHVWDEDPVAFSRRARYTAGTAGGKRVPAYVDEDGVDPGRGTETFAEIALAVDTSRWHGVPFRIRSGKALENRQEITITFRPPQHVPEGLRGYEHPDRLRIALREHDVFLDVNVSGAGDPFSIEHVTMHSEFGAPRLHAYGEVLRGVLVGDPPLSVRGDTAVELWRIVEPVLAAWRDDRVPLNEYPAGSNGPAGWPEHGLP